MPLGLGGIDLQISLVLSGAHEPPRAAKERVFLEYSRVPYKYKSWERASSNDFHIWKVGAHSNVA